MSQLQYRNQIARDYPKLLDLIQRNGPFIEGKDFDESVSIYQKLAENCAAWTFSDAHTNAIDDFAFDLASIRFSGELNPIVQRLRDRLKALDPIWLYRRAGDEWRVFRVDGEGHEEDMAQVETEMLAVMIVEMFGDLSRPTPQAQLEALPEGFRIEEGPDDDWDLYRTPEPLEEYDDPEEEWFARVNTEYMAQVLCERMIGYHV